MKSHDRVSLLKQLASDLGQIPTREEFLRVDPKAILTESQYLILLHAAGFEGRELAKKNKRVPQPPIDDPEVILKLIQESQQRRILRVTKFKRCLFIGDMHLPFTNFDALSLIYARVEKSKPDVIVQMGDLKDRYSDSRFPRSYNILTPEAEDALADKMAKDFWATIRKLAPKAELFQLMGNHDARPLKQVVSRWPEGEHLVRDAVKKLYTFDGVNTIYDPSEELWLGSEIAVIHGYRSGLGEHRDYTQANVICGHSHRGGVVFRPLKEKTLWELNCGYIGDPYSKALSYRHQKTHNWTLGLGELDEDGPRFIHF